jgi:cobalamin biosynthesis protein CobT
MKNGRIYILRESIAKIAQILAGSDIQVTQRGAQAYVRADESGKPILINLPFIPEGASEELCDAIQGFLDHEMGHVFFTEWPIIMKGAARGQAFSNMLNILEDPHVEKAMAGKFAGSGSNLRDTGRFFLNKILIPNLKKAQAEGPQAIEAALIVPLIRAMAGQELYRDFMKDRMHLVEGFYNKVKDLAPKIEACASTQDCFDVCEEIVARVCPPTSGGTSTAGVSKTSKEEKKSGGGKSEKKPSSKKGKREGKPSEEEKEEEEKEAGEEDEGEGEDEGEDEGEGEGEDEGEGEGEGEDEGDGPITSDEDGEPSTEINDAKESPIWEALDKDSANSFDESLSREISAEAVRAVEKSDYNVYTTDFDEIEPLHVGKGFQPTMLKKLQDEVDHMVGVLQKDLERAISARSMAVRSHGHRSGKLDASNLTRLTFNDPRVFSRKHEATTKDVAVSLVIDMSGSMSGAKIHCAAQTAYALSSTLERLGIKHEVICFTTKDLDGKDMSADIEREQRKLGIRYSRVEGLYMPVIRSFNERLTTEVRNRFAWLPHCGTMRNNVDGECVAIAGRRLLQRREAGKILIVLSDGYPAAYGAHETLAPHLKETVAELSKRMRVVGIGIQSDAPRAFYPKNVLINSISELPTKVIGQLKEALLDQSR